MFEPKPTARADMTAGTLYAVTGEGGWIYYGQVTPEKKVASGDYHSKQDNSHLHCNLEYRRKPRSAMTGFGRFQPDRFFAGEIRDAVEREPTG